MRAPHELRSAANERDDVVITRREYDDEPNVIAIDFGPDVDASLDVLGDTAIVVAGEMQFEFEVPADASDLTVNDGMLTITE